MDSLHSVLGKVLRKRGLEGAARAAQATFAADRVIAELLPKFAPLLHAQKCTQGTLVIAAEHSMASQECQAKISEILARLEEELGSHVVTEIRLVRS